MNRFSKTYQCDGVSPLNIPFVRNEKIEAVFIKEKDIAFEIYAVEGFTKKAEGTSETKNYSVGFSFLSTMCLTVKTDKPTAIEVLILK